LAAGGLAGAPQQAAPAASKPGQPSVPNATTQWPGSFQAHQFSNHAGSRAYKLYVPTRQAGAPRPVLVMLHGCTQSADDFAAGTQMNRLADEHGFLVVYPEQAAQANANRCWNWFKPQDQTRGAGEPALIAGIVGEVVHSHGADGRRVFVAGLSAGAAMAVALGETYPELFAGVGAHSGLPYGSAHDMVSALVAMKGGRGALAGAKGLPGAVTGTNGLPGAMTGTNGLPGASATPAKKATQAVPLIVFHGDRDHTVQAVNGTLIVQQALDAHAALGTGARLQASTQRGTAPGGRQYSRTVHANAAGQACIESWTLHGAGHAWSGGHPSGSYTDRAGPDASAEMLRFCLALPRAGSA
jgi:poly(hydroxyalkanoate) depolymerase family esterase